MAGSADEQEDKATAEKKSGGSKTLIIIVIAAFLVFVMVAGAGFFILWKRLPVPEGAKTEALENGAEGEEKAQLEIGPVYTLEPFVVNLADPSGSRFLRTKMTLEFQNEELLEKMDKLRFPVRDKILTILSSRKYEEIANVQGKKELRTEITATVDGLLGKGSIKNVYFSEFVAE